MSDEIPVACRLTDSELREREAALWKELKSVWSATEDLPGGYAFHLPGDKKWLALAAELIAAERECCPFLTFELIAEPNMGALTLRMTGPAGAKEFLKSILQ